MKEIRLAFDDDYFDVLKTKKNEAGLTWKQVIERGVGL